ncbi:hypothetical protein ACA910_006408 [Epithemia clementina (nom. ined.)]
MASSSLSRPVKLVLLLSLASMASVFVNLNEFISLFMFFSSSSSSSQPHLSENRQRHHAERKSSTILNVPPGVPPQEIGFLSTKPATFFQNFQDKIDQDDPAVRCHRYNFGYNSTHPKQRRIFYGALIASEPLELFHITSKEAHGIFAGMVFVESNRTQNFSPRTFARLGMEGYFQNLFGVHNLQIRPFVNEDASARGLHRENLQRQEILLGWKELGMRPEDLGFLTDSDEIFTRDFLRALQTCDTDLLEYHPHYCHRAKMGVRGSTQVYETSPECIWAKRSWFHPDVLIGHCIEEIGNETLHTRAPRMEGQSARVKGYGNDGWDKVPEQGPYPLYNAYDYRMIGPQAMKELDTGKFPEFQHYTAFHFHNFFTNTAAI